MDAVAGLLAGYPFDVLLGSVHWVGGWRFDDLDDPVSMAEWSARQVDACWEAYTAALEELAASRHLRRAGPPRPDQGGGPRARRARPSGGTASPRRRRRRAWRPSCPRPGWRKPVGEQYPAAGLLERFVARGVPLTTASDAHQPRPRGRPGRRPARRCWRRSGSTRCRATGAATPTRSRCRGRRGPTPDADPRRARPEPHRPQARGARAPAAAARELERPGRPLLLRPPPAGAGARGRR